MMEFPATALTRDPATLKEAARKAPVAITEHKRPRFVLMSFDAYEKLRTASGKAGAPDPRRSYATGETPQDLKALILQGLEQPYEA